MGSITTKVKIGDEDENIINPMKDETGQSILESLGVSGGYGLYAVLDDGTNLYICYQNKDDKWIITRINDTTGIVTYAKGSSDTATNWTNRATLDYNDYAHTF